MLIFDLKLDHVPSHRANSTHGYRGVSWPVRDFPTFVKRCRSYNLNFSCTSEVQQALLGLVLVAGLHKPNGKAGRMQATGSYMMVESMILKKKVLLFELKHLVNSLERRGLITPSEHDTLLRLGLRTLPKLPTDVIHQADSAYRFP